MYQYHNYFFLHILSFYIYILYWSYHNLVNCWVGFESLHHKPCGSTSSCNTAHAHSLSSYSREHPLCLSSSGITIKNNVHTHVNINSRWGNVPPTPASIRCVLGSGEPLAAKLRGWLLSYSTSHVDYQLLNHPRSYIWSDCGTPPRSSASTTCQTTIQSTTA